MDSNNIDILIPQWQEPANIGGFPEHYIHTDSSSASITPHIFCENFVENIYKFHNLKLPFKTTKFRLLTQTYDIQYKR